MRPEAAVLLLALGGPLPTPAEPLPPATALVTRVEGPATAEAPDGRLVALAPGRVLPGDWRLSVPAGASVALVCSNDRFVRLEAGSALRTTSSGGSSARSTADAACAAGDRLLPGTFRALARGDRDLAVERARDVRLRILQVRTRGSEEDDPRIPVLLAPRETSVTDPRPEIRWTRVAGAEEYVVELVGPEGWTARLAAEDVPCHLEAHPPGKLEVCTVPWPEDAPDLQPAASYFLTVGARTGIATPVREGEPRRLRLLPAGATGLEASLAALRELALPAAEADLRTAALLAEHDLRADAAAALRQSLLEAPSARAYLLQGSLELELLLPRAALRSFQESGRLGGDAPELAAEAEAGARAAWALLGDAPVEATSGEAPSDPLAEALALLDSVRREMELFHLGEALRLADQALARIEGRGYSQVEAVLLAYRGSLLSALQEPEAALPDLEPMRELLAQEVARRQPPEAPDLTPLVSVLPDIFLSLTSGDWGSGFERLQELTGRYGDLLPESFLRLFELLSLVQEERIAEAAEVCHRLLEAEDLSATGPLADLLGNLGGGLEPFCAVMDSLADMPEEGPADPAAMSSLFDAAGAMLQAGPGPLDEPLALLLEQVMKIPDAAHRPEAWPTAQDLLPSIESLQGVIARAAPPGLRSGLDSLFGQTPLVAIMILSHGSDAAGSFELAEEVRARELLDRVADAELAAGADAQAAARIASLREQRDELEAEFVELLSSDPTSHRVVELQAEVARVRRELDAEIHGLALGRPEDPRAVPLSLPEVQAVLDEDTTLVAYLTFAAPVEDDTLAWVVTQDDVHLVPLQVEAGALEGEVRLFVETLRRREPVDELAGVLYRRLWAPLRDHVRTRRVLLVPHGPLQELPFAVLRDPETGRWLVEDATLLHAPSATVWARLATRPGGGGAPPLVLGDPEGNLPAAAREARAVADLWGVRPLLGPDATEEALRSRAAGAPLVHVSAHGAASPEDPLFTRLRLAPSGTDPARDGRLELHEVMTGLDLAGTGLVVLPACHTGEGPRTRGDEVTNLARAFLLAGARSAVTTAWAVDDESTAALMVDFHRRLAAGADAAEALRRAQEAALASPGRAHPWHWAGVSLHGAGGPVAGIEGTAAAR